MCPFQKSQFPLGGAFGKSKSPGLWPPKCHKPREKVLEDLASGVFWTSPAMDAWRLLSVTDLYQIRKVAVSWTSQLLKGK